MLTATQTYFDLALHRLDLLLEREILRLRANYQLSLDEFRGLYVSDEQVDALIHRTLQANHSTPTVDRLTEEATGLRQMLNEQQADDTIWYRVMKEFALSPFEEDVLLLATAPEINLKYESLFGYLNNDVTRKWPTCDLALRLFAPSGAEAHGFRDYLTPQATLFRSGLLQGIQPVPDRPSWLSSGFCLTPIAARLLGSGSSGTQSGRSQNQHHLDKNWEQVPVSPDLRKQLRQIANWLGKKDRTDSIPVFVFEGREGSGTWEAAEAICHELGYFLRHLNLEDMRTSGEPLAKQIQGCILERQLLHLGLYLTHPEALCNPEGHLTSEGHDLVASLSQSTYPLFLGCQPGTVWPELVNKCRHVIYHFPDLDYSQRREWWSQVMDQNGATVQEKDLEVLANRFILTPGQIQNAVTTARDYTNLRKESSRDLSLATLLDAARVQSNGRLGSLAVNVKIKATWEDLVLPPATLTHVKEVTSAIKYRHVVYSEWGLEKRVFYGKGPKVLFAGTSGTGKTMTAGVIAGDLGLDLYKIDLSTVVSKYIGETEKNLERIFRSAQNSNAILFFDEADALFGKRSEVKDAHDRYANIEVAYLLQRLEEHEGTVILATNLSKNIEEAFSRRLHYVVTFPLPDEQYREQLWQGMYPFEAPVAKDVDWRFLAKQFPLSGGDIKNVALDAAFLAAQDGRVITMPHLVKAMARQMLKQGRMPSAADFRQYHALLVEGK